MSEKYQSAREKFFLLFLILLSSRTL